MAFQDWSDFCSVRGATRERSRSRDRRARRLRTKGGSETGTCEPVSSRTSFCVVPTMNEATTKNV